MKWIASAETGRSVLLMVLWFLIGTRLCLPAVKLLVPQDLSACAWRCASRAKPSSWPSLIFLFVSSYFPFHPCHAGLVVYVGLGSSDWWSFHTNTQESQPWAVAPIFNNIKKMQWFLSLLSAALDCLLVTVMASLHLTHVSTDLHTSTRRNTKCMSHFTESIGYSFTGGGSFLFDTSPFVGICHREYTQNQKHYTKNNFEIIVLIYTKLTVLYNLHRI